MEVFCRQQAEIQSEAAEFWLREAEYWRNRGLGLSRGFKIISRPDKQGDDQ